MPPNPVPSWFDEHGPYEMPDGRLVCSRHYLSICGKCCVDYTFMEEDLSDGGDPLDELPAEISPELLAAFQARFAPLPSPDPRVESGAAPDDSTPAHAEPLGPEDSFGPKMHRGTGLVFPTTFTPPSSTIRPTVLFPGKATYGGITRYVHRNNDRIILISTDGACLNNGQQDPKAGWAFVHGPGLAGRPQPVTAYGRLEEKGPWGDPSIQSSNRAELRAVIAALRFRHWTGEGFKRIVIATDSEYVTRGATEWVQKWIDNGWRTSGKLDVKNKDLWEMLLGEVERWYDEGLRVEFWRIPREWNTDADAAAKKAAQVTETPEVWQDILGVLS